MVFLPIMICSVLLMYYALDIKSIPLLFIFFALYLLLNTIASIILEWFQLRKFKANHITIDYFNVTAYLTEELVIEKSKQDVYMLVKKTIPPIFPGAQMNFWVEADCCHIVTPKNLNSWGEIVEINIVEIEESKTRVILSSKPKLGGFNNDGGNSAINIFKMKRALFGT